MSQIVIIYRGVPGSGKSTEAQRWLNQNPQNRARVNRDGIRKEVFGNYVISNDLEPLVTKLELEMFEMLLASKKSVCVDDTNIRMKAVKPFMEIAARYDVPVVFKDFDVDLKVALKQNAGREKQVPEEVIKRMFKTFQSREKNPQAAEGFVEMYTPNIELPKAVLVDIDGTLMNISPERGPFEWDKVILDTPNMPVVETVKALKAAGYKIVVMSGREDTAKEDTILSLTDATVEYDALFMRKAGDMRPDWQIKLELFNENLRNVYNIEFALDDRNQVVDFYRKKLNLTVFQVNYGNF